MKQDSFQSRYRWIMLCMLWLLYIAFGLVARSITPLITPIQNDLDMSYSQMGFALGSWQLTYILVALVAGAILDRWGIRKSIFAGALVIGFSASIRYFAAGFFTILVAIALFGVGGTMISIGGPKTISAWFIGRSRGIVQNFSLDPSGDDADLDGILDDLDNCPLASNREQQDKE